MNPQPVVVDASRLDDPIEQRVLDASIGRHPSNGPRPAITLAPDAEQTDGSDGR